MSTCVTREWLEEEQEPMSKMIWKISRRFGLEYEELRQEFLLVVVENATSDDVEPPRSPKEGEVNFEMWNLIFQTAKQLARQQKGKVRTISLDQASVCAIACNASMSVEHTQSLLEEVHRREPQRTSESIEYYKDQETCTMNDQERQKQCRRIKDLREIRDEVMALVERALPIIAAAATMVLYAAEVFARQN